MKLNNNLELHNLSKNEMKSINGGIWPFIIGLAIGFGWWYFSK
tara:strand:- start:93 stop:221 length:129 start_codon:yes stop_codon:yes gene_type:complete